MTKLILRCDSYLLSRCQLLIGALPVAFRSIDHQGDNGEWLRTNRDEWMTLEERYLDFYTARGYAGEKPVSLPAPDEDADLFNLAAYRQDPEAAWELHVWDSTEAMLILTDPVDFQLPEPWRQQS